MYLFEATLEKVDIYGNTETKKEPIEFNEQYVNSRAGAWRKATTKANEAAKKSGFELVNVELLAY